MHHLFLGIDPTELGGAPFALATGLAGHLPGARAGSEAQSRRLCLCAALHRRPCRCRHGGRGACRKRRTSRTRSCWPSMSAPMPRSCWARRRGCWPVPRPRDRPSKARRSPRGQRAAPGAIERIRIDPRDAGAALQGDRQRSLVGRAGLRGGGRADRRHRHLRLGHHRGHRGDVSRRHHQPGWRGRRRAGGAQPAHRALQAHLQLCHPAAARGWQRAADPRDAERRARHPAGQGRALCRHAAADGQARHRRRWTRSASPAPSAATST